MNARRPHRRRGVLLLVVLSLLTLFTLAGFSFLIVAQQYRRAARAASRHETVRDPPRILLDGAMYQLLRGPGNPSSVLVGHSLLEDLYGRDGVQGTITVAHRDVGGQFLRLKFIAGKGDWGSYNGFHNGAVLTIFDGPARAHSTRVTGYYPESPGGRIDGGTILVEAFGSNIIPPVGSSFVINGHPFNGAGAGYNPTSTTLDLADGQGRPVALLPNLVARRHDNSSAWFNVGGMDESWDAPDYQNMFLAWQSRVADTIIPSFHRPALINYWMNRSQWSDPQLRRSVILRPLPFPGDHPHFTGSNPALALSSNDPESVKAIESALLNGPWDVDNDNDGVPDSIWLDLGYPAEHDEQGRAYKPLFATLCVDLDGRVNLNAHGNLAQLNRDFVSAVPTDGMTAGGDRILNLPRGQGYGPAEINLSALLGPDELRKTILGRYGPDGLPGRPGDDLLSQIKSIGVPFDYSRTGALSGYANWPDLWGRSITALDHAGHPLTAFAGLRGETVDDPYELSLVEPNGTDELYSVAELECLLRAGDMDIQLGSSRLGSIQSLLDDRTLSRALTTRSFHIPTPHAVAPPGKRRPNQRLASHVIALAAQRLADAGVPSSMIEQQLTLMLAFELRHGQRMDVNRLWGNGRNDVQANLSDRVGVVDEPREAGSGQETVFDSLAPVTADYINDDLSTADQAMARQVYARHLYCLMMLLVDGDFLAPVRELNPLTPQQRRELTAQRIAQWAINVVDFRDPDAIMTPFEYDVDPFNSNGWDVRIDGYASTVEPGDRRLVWGCEYPDLIMTESLAFHDRRVKDTDQESVEPGEEPQKRVTAKMPEQEEAEEGDDDLDQYRIPEGSLFIELYCTGGQLRNNPVVPRELYDVRQRGQARLDLGRMAPAHRGQQYPVWRIAISHSHHNSLSSPEQSALTAWSSTSFQPENMSLLATGQPQRLPIERFVWLAARQPMPGVPNRRRIFYNRLGPQVFLPAGSYAVVGPRPVTHFGSKKRNGGSVSDWEPSAQRIELANTGVSYSEPVGASSYPAVGDQIQRPLAIIAAAEPPPSWTNPRQTAPSGIGVSVSEPLPHESYYPEPSHALDEDAPEGLYSPPRDNPLDSDEDATSPRPLRRDDLLPTATTPDYKTAFLQRLANPLLPWNPMPGDRSHNSGIAVNPYITVDWMPIDLTVFNGEDERPAEFPLEEFDRDDPSPNLANVMFQTRERGQRGDTNSNLWSPLSARPTPMNQQPVDEDYFGIRLRHTLGYLNDTYTPNGRSALTAVPPSYVGAPPIPFPWLAWNNRPFVSHLELLLVPAASPGRLLHEFSLASTASSPYDADVPISFQLPFAHLLNFFHTSSVRQSLSAGGNAGHFYRVLDYLEVPSRFVGTEKWYNPSTSGHFGDKGQLAAQTYRPPFNKLSRFRDPGRININTIADPRVWAALGGSRTPWSKVVDSRRGYRGSGLNPAFPSRFANPFRSASSADLMPLANLIKKGVEATLLRPDHDLPTRPLFAITSNRLFDRTDRAAYFYYLGLQRLGNLITTHSNVFAVWITVGYFEANPHPIDAAHPDGYQLGPELGSATGEVARNRAFYIIDRSVPVAFVPGRNHNVDLAVVLRRIIE